ncbi:MAG: TonB-dependent receptor [Flammeovirgaceae bacterium]|nr:TonB-dependent receptor [Flammeovirgaceae bacterium]
MKLKLIRQILIMSRYALFGIFLQNLLVSMLIAKDGNGQKENMEDVFLTVNIQNKKVEKAFSEIEKKTRFSFLYHENILFNKRITINQENGFLADLLRVISKETKLKFKRINENIFVSEIETNPDFSSNVIELEEVLQNTITGMVTSIEGEILPGVSILIKGTTTGTTSDVSGKYKLDVSSGSILQYSYIGFITQEVEIGKQTIIDIKLAPDLEQLDEVVVVGYGTQKKRDVIGSVASVSAEEITRVPVSSLDAGLQGLAPGVQAVGTGGVPGAPVRILVRGTNSISAGTDPLYIVDGMPIYSGLNGLERTESTTPQSPLSTINPNDIESIEVLKDAAATAIYGSRGSNGVVIITTKSGKGQSGGFDFTFNTGVTDIIKSPDKMDYAETAGFFQLLDETRANSGLTPYDPSFNTNLFIDNPVATISREDAMNTNTNWFDEILQKGKFQELNLALHNSTEKANYFISANYRDDEGVLKTNRFQRFSLRTNSDINILNNLKAGIRLNFSYTKNDRVKSDGGGGLQGDGGGRRGGFAQANSNALTWYPIYNADHQSGYWNPLSGNNLTANIDESLLFDEVNQYRVLGNFYLDYALPWVKGLSLRTELSADFIQNNSIFWVSEFLRENGSSATDQAVTYRSLNYNFYGTYNQTFGDIGVNVVVGTESQETNQYRRFMQGEDLPSTYQQLGNPNNFIGMYAGLENERALRSFFGRGDFKFKDKYLVGVSFRRDGSSAFSKDSRWANFSALSAGWIISEEEFFNTSFFDMLKIRGSFGQTGNQNIGNNRFTTTFRNDRRYLSQELLNGGTSITNLGASDLTWETTNSYDVGIDFEMFGGRLNGSVAYYNQDVEDMLLQVPLPLSITLDNSNPIIWANAGRMKNSGMEFNFTSVNIHSNDFKWTTNFNITSNATEVKNLTEDVDKNGQGIIADNTITRTGGKLGAYFLAEYAGIDQEKGVEMIYEIDRDLYLETGQTVKTGNIIPATLTNVRDHRVIHEDQTGLPTYYGGFNNTFEYKGFDLNVFFTFMGGNEVYDYTNQRSHYAARGNRMLKEELIGNTWRADNTNAPFPELRWDMAYNWDWDSENGEWIEAPGNYNNETFFHDRFLEKANFIRLKNLTLGYSFSKLMATKIHMQHLRVYVSAANLLTFTNFKGWDPEVIVTNRGNLNLSPGMVYLPPLPHLKIYSVGVNAKF